jgi:hypothetical protein
LRRGRLIRTLRCPDDESGPVECVCSPGRIRQRYGLAELKADIDVVANGCAYLNRDGE